MGEDDAGDGGGERGRYRGRHPASHSHRGHPPAVPADPGDQGAQGRTQVDERAVLSHGCAGAEGYEARQSRQEPGARRNPALQSLNHADDVGGAVGAALRDVAKHEPDHEPAHRRHAKGGEHHPMGVVRHDPAARRYQQPVVQDDDQLHEQGSRPADASAPVTVPRTAIDTIRITGFGSGRTRSPYVEQARCPPVSASGMDAGDFAQRNHGTITPTVTSSHRIPDAPAALHGPCPWNLRPNDEERSAGRPPIPRGRLPGSRQAPGSGSAGSGRARSLRRRAPASSALVGTWPPGPNFGIIRAPDRGTDERSRGHGERQRP